MGDYKRTMSCGCVVAVDYDRSVLIVYCSKHNGEAQLAKPDRLMDKDRKEAERIVTKVWDMAMGAVSANPDDIAIVRMNTLAWGRQQILALIDPKLEGRKAFLALPIEERRRLLAEQVMLMDEQDREAREDLHKLD